MIDGMLVVVDRPHTPLFPRHCATEVAGWYVRGHLMRVALTYKDGGYQKGMEPVLERLDNVDEVWAMCFRKPPPGWRFLGRFVERNTFVALRPYDRHALAARGAYIAASNDVVEDWRNLFGTQAPHRGSTIEDYLGGVVANANEDN